MPHTNRPIDDLTPEARATLESGQALSNNQIPATIDSSALTPQPDISSQITTPQTVAAFPVSGLDSTVPQLLPTEPEQQAEGLTQRIIKLQQQTLGQSAFRTGEEERQ